MPTQNDALKDRLSRYREINISVTGRKSGHTISIPVWFVLDDEKLYLLPVHGSDTQWYKNVLNNPVIRIDVRGAEAEFQVVPITDATRVSSVVEKFRDKYGANDVKKYYSTFAVAVLAQIEPSDGSPAAKHGHESLKIDGHSPFDEPILRRYFSLWTARHACRQARSNLAA